MATTKLRAIRGLHAEFLAAIDDDHQRAAILAVAPGAEECISYGLAAFRHNGRMLVGFAAAKKHCSFYLWSGHTVKEHADLLAKYDTSAGTIRFQPKQPLPVALVKKLVKARIAENAELDAAKGRA